FRRRRVARRFRRGQDGLLGKAPSADSSSRELRLGSYFTGRLVSSSSRPCASRRARSRRPIWPLALGQGSKTDKSPHFPSAGKGGAARCSRAGLFEYNEIQVGPPLDQIIFVGSGRRVVNDSKGLR